MTSALRAIILGVVLSASAHGATMAIGTPAQTLRAMLGHNHFTAEENGLYTGVHDPILRAHLNSQVDSAAGALAVAFEGSATSAQLLEIFKKHLFSIDRDALDTEDAEHVAGMFEQMLDALGIASSQGALNTCTDSIRDEA